MSWRTRKIGKAESIPRYAYRVFQEDDEFAVQDRLKRFLRATPEPAYHDGGYYETKHTETIVALDETWGTHNILLWWDAEPEFNEYGEVSP
jgi:hypothetical protein